MEWLMGSIGACMQEGKLPSVVEERRLEQSLFPARLHPKCGVLDKELLSAWREAYGSAWAKDLDKMCVNNIASLAGYFWPNSLSAKRATTLIKLMQWFTLVDDAVDDLNAPQADKLCHRLIHHIFNSSCTPPGQMQQLEYLSEAHEKEALIISVSLEFWNEMQASTSPTQRARFAAEFTRYLLNQVGFIRFREKLLQAELEEYVLIRRASSGFPVCVAMIEYDVGIELDEETLKNPLLQQLHEAACDHAACINDILSFPKEFANGDMLNLLPLLHMRNNDGKTEVPFQVAVSQAWQMAHARQLEVARLAHSLYTANKNKQPGLESYVESVCSFSAGIWAWTLQSPRYTVSPTTFPKSHNSPKVPSTFTKSHNSPRSHLQLPKANVSFKPFAFNPLPFGLSFRSPPPCPLRRTLIGFPHPSKGSKNLSSLSKSLLCFQGK